MSASSPKAQIDKPPALPLVVLIGFAASAELSEKCCEPAFRKKIEDRLRQEFKKPDGKLKLTENHFFCGLTRMCGEADEVFTGICKEMGIPQRILLSRDLEAQLAAGGFTDERKSKLRDLVAERHIIQQRVISRLNEPQEGLDRDLDVDFEIVRVCDIFICLTISGAAGSEDADVICEAAERRGKPVLQLGPGNPDAAWTVPEGWKPPALLPDLDLPADLNFPAAKEEDEPENKEGKAEPRKFDRQTLSKLAWPYRKILHDASAREALAKQRFFKYAGLGIVLTHLLATLCATFALKIKDHHDPSLKLLLIAEVCLLLAGFLCHLGLHAVDAARKWAMSRVVSEVACSVTAMWEIHAPLDYLFQLPFPAPLRPLLRTLHVIHLADTSERDLPELEIRAENYRVARVEGQKTYYEDKCKSAWRWNCAANGVFFLMALSAIIATGWKLYLVLLVLPKHADLAAWLGIAAIGLPVVAVSALSLAASRDTEARIHTYKEIVSQIDEDLPLLRNVKSVTELARLALIMEARLLGETANWASRRSFTGIT